jgi:hypothetical protein
VTDRGLRRLAWMVFGLVLSLQLGAAVFSFLNRAAHYPAVPTFDTIGVTTVLFAAVGAPVAARQPRNPIGWIMLGTLFRGASSCSYPVIRCSLSS